MTKKEPTEKIKLIAIGGKDPSGNNIAHVLASGNEYAIYEIDHSDINYRLRVIIDGNDDESEKAIIEKFNKVKQKYIEAKGLLYRSSNYGMMKNRVAHMLSTCFTSETIDGNAEFDKLIDEIKKEHEDSLKSRTCYIAPCIVLTALFFIWALSIYSGKSSHPIYWQVVIALLASSIGGSISILSNVRKLHLEEYTSRLYYFFIGIERVFLSCIAGAVAFIAVKAGFLLPALSASSEWTMMMILVVAGFSESYVPGIIGKVERENA